MLRIPILPLLTLFAVPAFAQGNPTISWPQRTFDEALARYKECMRRAAFYFHWEARQVLGNARSLDGLTVLVKDYETAKTHPEFSKYVLAEVFGQYFRAPEFLPTLQGLCERQRGPGDVWLWYHTLSARAERGNEAEVMTIATEDKNPLLRAAAILALGDVGRADLKRVIVPNCLDFPKKDADRMALLGAMTGALFANKSRVNAEDYREALRAYISLLAEPVKLSHVAKVQMARHLQIILKGPALFVNPEPWLEILDRGEVKIPKANTTTAQRFFGIETDGERIVYVVDMSDSMLKPIEPSAKPTGPITGPKEKKKKGALLDEGDLPWASIKTRWDLARENLRISLSRLTPDKEFCVVWFGSEAGTLKSCEGLVKATRANIDKVMAELDGIKADHSTTNPQDPPPPEGRLRGDTNMHGGLLMAFSLHDTGFADKFAYVDPKALANGCDTVLLLSDGDPSVDSFTQMDKNYGEGKIVRSFERGEPAPDAKEVRVNGPFTSQGIAHCPTIVAEVQRMNAFRRIRIHAVGLGEANMTLMKELARIGTGECLSVGKKQ